MTSRNPRFFVLQDEDALEEHDESRPRVGVVRGALGVLDHRADDLLHDSRGEVVLVAEVAVRGADSDSRLASDVIEAGLQPAPGEDIMGRAATSSARLRAASLAHRTDLAAVDRHVRPPVGDHAESRRVDHTATGSSPPGGCAIPERRMHTLIRAPARKIAEPIQKATV